MYGEMRLNDEAKATYTQALKLAESEGNLFTQAEAAGGLWCITNDQAGYERAMQLYQSIGESEPLFVCKKRK